MSEQRAPTLYTVPMGTEVAHCRSARCNAEIYFVPSLKDPKRVVPISCATLEGTLVEGGKLPTATEDGAGIIHHIVCVDRDRFREHRPPARRRKPQQELAIAHRPPACVFCGCTADKPCRLPLTEGGVEGEALPLDPTGRPAETVQCGRFSIEPPICSAQACMKRFEDLPVHERLAVHQRRAAAAETLAGAGSSGEKS